LPKTTFINGDASQGTRGTRVTAEYLNAINNHHHTGLDEDGHGALAYAADTGTANAYVVALSPALFQYITGMPIFFKAANACSGASTININGLGVKTIKKNITEDITAGDIQSGQVVMVIYDGTNFQLVGGLNTHMLDGYHASAAATANTIPVLNASAKLPGNITGDADTVDTFHASATPTANTIPVRNANADLDIKWAGELSNKITSDTYCDIDLGTVNAGERFFVQARFNYSMSTSTAFYFELTSKVGKHSGTATIQFDYDATTLDATDFRSYSSAAPMTLNHRIAGVMKITGSGTLILSGWKFSLAGSGTYSLSSNNIQLSVVKLK